MTEPLTNYHSHTQYCDGRATIQEFVDAAILQGFSAWGVSPHCHLPMQLNSHCAMKAGSLELYVKEMTRLKELYKNEIRLLMGIEADYIDKDFNPSSDYFQSVGFDYIIGSVHLLRSPQTSELLDIDCPISLFEKSVKNHFSGSLQKLIEAYYSAKCAMIEAGGFTFLGHADKVSANASLLSSNVTSKLWYRDLMEEFLVLCAKSNTVLEINTKAYYSHGIFFPDRRNFKRMEELGIRVIINSDTHRPERATVGLREARELYRGEIITL